MMAASEYEPRYKVGDRYRDGLGAVWEITEIYRASAADRTHGPWAISVGWTCYHARVVGGDRRSATTTSHLHSMIDRGYRGWAYLGPNPEVAGDGAAFATGRAST